MDKVPLLPKLRTDLEFIQNGVHEDGSPIWLIYDPVQHRYANISWKEYAILSLWKENSCYADFLKLIQQETTVLLTEEELISFIKLVEQNNYSELPEKEAAQKLFQKNQAQKQKESIWHSWKKILFMRFKLCNPKRFLESTLPYLRWMFHRYFAYTLFFLLFLDIYLLSLHWSQFSTQFAHFFNFEGVIFLVAGLILTKIIHELGHAYASTYHRADITNMGVAILLFFPVLYTDATDSWKLSHKKRVYIDAGGIIAELGLAIIATFLWFYLPDGALRSVVHTAASVSWISSLAINLNPLMRFDGYYLLSDATQIKNLQPKSFSAATWFLRKKLWGIDDPIPATLPRKKLRFLIFLGIFTWIYRLFLFIGIAILVYHFLFKLLGVILFFLEIIVFILLPIFKELHYLWRHRQRMKCNKNTLLLIIGIALFLGLLFVPWKHSIAVPAMLSYAQAQGLYTNKAGKLTKLYVKPYQKVKKDQILACIYSEQLHYNIQHTQLDIEKIKTRLSSEIDQARKLGFQQASLEDLNAQEAKLKGLRAIQINLAIRAPYSGTIHFVDEGAKVGAYVKKSTLLFEILNNAGHYRVDSFIPEVAIDQINWECTPYFYSKKENTFSMPAKIISRDLTRTHYLERLYLASTNQGDIAAEIDPKTQKIKVKQPYYRVVLEAETEKQPILKKVTIGYTVFGLHAHSLAYSLSKKILATLIRESEF